jgi:hypothetical protein
MSEKNACPMQFDVSGRRLSGNGQHETFDESEKLSGQNPYGHCLLLRDR